MAISVAPAMFFQGLAKNVSSSASSIVIRADNISHRQHDPLEGFDVDYSEPGWDGDGAEPILPETVASARRFHAFLSTVERNLPLPNIAPGADGTIGFEWRSKSSSIKKIFVEIRARNLMRAYWIRSGTSTIERQPIRDLNVAMYSLQRTLTELSDAG